jgi:phosphate transport system permease protein
MQARIARRYRAERRFRRFGLAALSIAGAFLLFLLFSVISKGYTGFLATEVKLAVPFDEFALGIDPTQIATPAGQAAIDRADFRSAVAQASSSLPVAAGAAERLLSDGAWLSLRDALREDMSRLGKTVDVWVPAATDIDQLAKGLIDRNLPQGERPISDADIAAFDKLKAAGLVRTRFNTGFFQTADSTSPELAGIWGAAKGSLLTLAITLAVCFPIGVFTAIYLEEYAPRNRWTDIIEVSINNLAAVPSIIFGLLGLAVFLNTLGMPRSAPVVGGLTLALMTLPVIVIAGRVAIKAVPPSIRDAALGIGASQVQVVFHHVLPLALPGILTGTIIGMARALGETAPLLMIGMRAFVSDVPAGLSNPATVLPVQIFLWSDEVARGFIEKTSAAIMVLLVFLLLMNGLAIYLRNKFEKRW